MYVDLTKFELYIQGVVVFLSRDNYNVVVVVVMLY